MTTTEIICMGLLAVLCLAIGHIGGYITRKKEEPPGRISVIISNKEFADLCKQDANNILAFYYKGEPATNVEFRVVDTNSKNIYIKK